VIRDLILLLFLIIMTLNTSSCKNKEFFIEGGAEFHNTDEIESF